MLLTLRLIFLRVALALDFRKGGSFVAFTPFEPIRSIPQTRIRKPFFAIAC
jgi:hypothetical protein